MMLPLRSWALGCLVASTLCSWAGAALAAPAQVLIIRHGEKDPDSGNLTERGWERARALVNYFKTSPDVTKFGLPVAIYATGAKHDDSAVRTIQTVTPLAQDLGQTLHTEFYKRDIPDLVDAVLNNPDYDGRSVLICWKHSGIPQLAKAFGARQTPGWEDDVFDRTWVLRFDHDGRVTSLDNLPQHLLSGDSASYR